MNSSCRFVAVDIGNSSTKLGWFDLPARQAGSVSRLFSSNPLLPLHPSEALPAPLDLADFPTATEPSDDLAARLAPGRLVWRVASVHREGQRTLENWLKTHRAGDDVRILRAQDLPLEVQVDYPERVGLDRLAAAVAANAIRSAERPAIVVDAGSAVTVDLVDRGGAFQGGVILPGFRLQAQSLFGGADLLPLALLQPTDEPPPVVGKNTEAAIRSGLFWGAVGAVREVIQRVTAQLGQEPQVFVTGGDLARLTPLVSQHAEFVPHMVLAGIRLAYDS
jgi:type III pantothenate kinase